MPIRWPIIPNAVTVCLAERPEPSENKAVLRGWVLAGFGSAFGAVGRWRRGPLRR